MANIALKLAVELLLIEVQKNRTETKRQKQKETLLESGINATDQELAKLTQKITEIATGGVVIPHYPNTGARDAAIAAPAEGQVCYVGSSGNWLLYSYENGAWVAGHISNHETAADDVSWKNSKQDKITGKPLLVLGGEVFTAAYKTMLDGLVNTYATKAETTLDDASLKALQGDVI